MVSVADIVSRFSYPLIVKASRVSSGTAFLIGVAGLGIVRLLLLSINIENYDLVLYVCVALGFFRALTVVNQVLILVDFCEKSCPAKLPGTLGMSVVIRTCILVLFSWAFNRMQNFSQDLSMNFYVQIILFLSIILIWIIDR